MDLILLDRGTESDVFMQKDQDEGIFKYYCRNLGETLDDMKSNVGIYQKLQSIIAKYTFKLRIPINANILYNGNQFHTVIINTVDLSQTEIIGATHPENFEKVLLTKPKAIISDLNEDGFSLKNLSGTEFDFMPNHILGQNILQMLIDELIELSKLPKQSFDIMNCKIVSFHSGVLKIMITDRGDNILNFISQKKEIEDRDRENSNQHELVYELCSGN